MSDSSPRYAPIWAGNEDLLESARHVDIAECYSCRVEWNVILDPDDDKPRGIDQFTCPECGKRGDVRLTGPA